MHSPIRKRTFERPQPFLDAGFARIDFLAFTHQADDRAPICVAIHDAEQELRLRHGEAEVPTLLPHELRGLLDIPCSLRLIEDGDFLNWRGVRRERIVPEMMDILDEGRGA